MALLAVLLLIPLARAQEKPAVEAPVPDHAALGRTSLKLLFDLMGHKDPEIRAQAATAWGEIGNPAAIPVLRKALKDKNPHVRVEAAYSLHRLGTDEGLDAVERIIRASTSTAPGAPGESAPAKPRAPKASGLDRDPAPNTIPNGGQGRSASGLDRDPAEEMRLIARNKSRVAAIERMADMGGERAVRLFEVTLQDPSGTIRDASAVALAHMGLDEFADGFIEALGNKDDRVRAAAAKALGQIGRLPRAASLSLRAAAGDPVPEVRAQALRALGKAREPDHVDVLRRGAKDADLMTRAMAVEALAAVPDSKATEVLYEVLPSTAVPAFTLKVMAALASRGEAIDLSLAERVLGQRDADLMVDAVHILKSVNNDRSTGLLRRALEESGDARVKLHAAAALVKRLQRGSVHK